ncbi:glycosyltransferase family 2 protein [Polymorphobacter arshaanensis]|uniref:Glycosyltransferase family 2 protein n=2 Tax=Glacieibacterium arshaanense TaxID=2511025 RepID=A0A4Y9EP68_9SPHN|nr:glycosyltransferase family 2 protein [Polymorphobacter arshaanensis]
MPCLNEAETLAICIIKAKRFLVENNVHGEVLIADNGSTDGSQSIARQHGARVINVPVRGYGAALAAGIEAAAGRYVAMADADDSYDFLGLMPFLERLRAGDDLVMGNRFKGGIAPGAMPPLHRYLGNPVLSLAGRLFFKAPVGDFHCGLRAFRRNAILQLGLVTTGMEFASEMVVKAQLAGLKLSEVPTTLVPDGRSRAPHLRSWRDGWRHLKFLLTYAPKWLAFYPGLIIGGIGLIGTLLTIRGTFHIAGLNFGVHSLLLFATGIMVGAQLVSFAVLARLFGVHDGLWKTTDNIELARRWFTIDRCVVYGLLLVLAGLGFLIWAVGGWAVLGFHDIHGERLMRVSIMAVLFLSLGVQAMISGFIAALLGND